ncbi:hypothetical protein [Yoonia sp. GPGPB17]|uniref:hypothetical protein n=1 Tax=Yoonia sp. GPGPB17 TaxID=3026147 RepID=UPI0030ED42BE
MHSGFQALREACPMMLSFCWEGFEASQAVQDDLLRIEDLWSLARARHGANGPWLFGEYSLADVFYAPVAMRITAYKLSVSDESQAYVSAHLSDPAFLAWRKAAMEDVYEPFPYELPLARSSWPGDTN